MEDKPFKRVKLNYMPAVHKTPPVAKIPVSASRMEELDKIIKEKCKQNCMELDKSRIKCANYLVR